MGPSQRLYIAHDPNRRWSLGRVRENGPWQQVVVLSFEDCLQSRERIDRIRKNLDVWKVRVVSENGNRLKPIALELGSQELKMGVVAFLLGPASKVLEG